MLWCVFGCLGGLFCNSGFLSFKGISVLMRDLSYLISSAKNIFRVQPCIVETFANSDWFSNNYNVWDDMFFLIPYRPSEVYDKNS